MTITKSTRATNRKKGEVKPPTPHGTLKAYGLQEVADILGVHYRTMQRIVAAGEIKTFHAGRQVRVSHAALAAYMGES